MSSIGTEDCRCTCRSSRGQGHNAMKPHVSDAAPAPGPATESHHGCEGRCPGPSKEDRPASPPSCHDTCKCPSLTCGRCCQHSGSQLQHTQNGPAAATAAAAAAAGGAEASGAVVLLSTGEASGGREVAQCSVGGRDEEGDYHSLQLQGSSVSRWGDTVAGEETMSEAGAMESLERLPHAGCARAHQGPSHVEATAVFEGRRVQGEGANWEASSEVAVLTIACAGNCECMGVCCGHGSAYDEHGNESDGRGSACDRCAGREQVVDLLALGVGNFSLSLPARCQMALALLLAQALQLQLQQRQAGVFKCWIDAVARVACPHSQSMTPSVAFWLHANVWYLPHLWLPHGLTGTGILLWPHFRPPERMDEGRRSHYILQTLNFRATLGVTLPFSPTPLPYSVPPTPRHPPLPPHPPHPLCLLFRTATIAARFCCS